MYSSCIEKQKYSVIPSLLLSFTGTVSFTHRVYIIRLVSSPVGPEKDIVCPLFSFIFPHF